MSIEDDLKKIKIGDIVLLEGVLHKNLLVPRDLYSVLGYILELPNENKQVIRLSNISPFDESGKQRDLSYHEGPLGLHLYEFNLKEYDVKSITKKD